MASPTRLIAWLRRGQCRIRGKVGLQAAESWRYRRPLLFARIDERGSEMKIKSISLALVLFISSQGNAQSAKADLPSMAPLEQYLMSDRNAEIALARTAAPESISGNAEILILTRRGFETAVKGTNGFVCMVARSWSAYSEDPDFWNPKLRVPICYNAVAARSQVPVTMKRTEVVLAGGSKARFFDAIKAAIESRELPTAEPGAVAYMLSRQGYLNDHVGHWLPHLMFYTPQTDPKGWGAGLPGSPMIGFEHTTEHSTVFIVPVSRWSDGTPAPSDEP